MILQILLALTIISSTVQFDEKCLESNDKCNSMNYQSYANCVRKRSKRSIDCDTDCTDCDCASCNYSNCNSSCDSCCGSCCKNYIPCGTNDCCRNTCKVQCKSSDCGRKCRRNCNENIKIIYERNNTISTKNDNKVNVTTVINLNSIINTSNVIDIPIQIHNNNTNLISAEHFHGNDSGKNNCCIVISPKQCIFINERPYIKCVHYRTRQCGDFCTATIVHKERREICHSPYPGVIPNCRPQIIYIPQPQPKCRYESTWPYVSCGIKKSTTCAGCYASKRSKTYMACPPDCYDTGFENNPYYRRGPFYRRNYLGDNGFGAFGYGGYGGYGTYPYGMPNTDIIPPRLNDFEHLSPDGIGYANDSFEPDVSFDESHNDINVGPNLFRGYDTLRNMREIEVEGNYTPRPAVPVE